MLVSLICRNLIKLFGSVFFLFFLNLILVSGKVEILYCKEILAFGEMLLVIGMGIWCIFNVGKDFKLC